MRSHKWLFFLGMLALVGTGAYSLLPKARVVWLLWHENKRLSAQVENMERNVAALNKHIDQRDNPRIIEEEARLRLQLRKPGEQILIIVSPKEEAPTTSPPATASEGIIVSIENALKQWVKKLW